MKSIHLHEDRVVGFQQIQQVKSKSRSSQAKSSTHLHVGRVRGSQQIQQVLRQRVSVLLKEPRHYVPGRVKANNKYVRQTQTRRNNIETIVTISKWKIE